MRTANLKPPQDTVYWFDRPEPPLASLSGAVSADVVIVGGGMMGLMCARLLAARGRKICLLEAGTCGGGASGRSSGFITPDSELEFQDLVQQFGPEKGRKLWEFAWSGVSAIRQAVTADNISCDFQLQDALFVAATAKGAKVTSAEHHARQSAGYPSTLYSRRSLPTVLGSTAYFGGVRCGDTFSLDSYRCCAGLRRLLRESGVRIFEQSPVTRLLAQGVETTAGAVRAAQVIVCADRFLPSLGLARREIYHAQTFLAISEPLDRSEAARLFPEKPLLVWDTGLVYKYFRLTGDQRLLIGGGTLAGTYAPREQHRPQRVARRLTRYLAPRFPDLKIKFAACWPGLIGISKDFAPIVGHHPEYSSVHFAGGAAGLPWAAALGRYLAEKILEGRSDLDEVLSVQRRFPIGPHWHALLGTPPAFALSHGILKFSPR